MSDHAMQARELLDEIRLAEATADKLAWGDSSAEQEMRDTLRHVYADALVMLDDEMPVDERLRLSTYDLIAELREWRENMEWLMATVPSMRKP